MASPATKATQTRSLADIDPTNDAEAAAWERQALAEGHARVLAETERLRRLGIIDSKGDLVTDELPPDMQPDSKTDVSSL